MTLAPVFEIESSPAPPVIKPPLAFQLLLIESLSSPPSIVTFAPELSMVSSPPSAFIVTLEPLLSM